MISKSVQLYGEEWKPRRELKKCQDECFKVAEILGVHAVVGEEATKDRFMKELQEATIIHVGKFFVSFFPKIFFVSILRRTIIILFFLTSHTQELL